MTEHIGTVEFRRQVSPKQYETAEAKVTMHIYGDPAQFAQLSELAFIEAKTLVYDELGIESEVVDTKILERAVQIVDKGFAPEKASERPRGGRSGGGRPSSGATLTPPHQPKAAKRGSTESRENQEWALFTFMDNPDAFWANYRKDTYKPNQPALELREGGQAFWLDDDLQAQLP